MPKTFAIKTLITSSVAKNGNKKSFPDPRTNSPSDGVFYTDQVLALAPTEANLLHYNANLTVDSTDLIKYGYVLHAGEPAYNADSGAADRAIVKLVIGATASALNAAGAPNTWKTVLTFEYPTKIVIGLNEAGVKFDEIVYDADSPPVTYPDPDPQPDTSLPNYEDHTDPDVTADDAHDPDPDDTSEEGSEGEGSDCDGIIGVWA